MLIRETPKNPNNYIIVDNLTSQVLQMCGFSPKYMDDKYLYYIKDECIVAFMEREGLVCKNI